MADVVESSAERSPFPNRCRRLARDMRARATQIELGAEEPAGRNLDRLASVMLGAFR